MVHRYPQTIQLTNHLANGHVLTIRLPDMSGNRMPTVDLYGHPSMCTVLVNAWGAMKVHFQIGGEL